MGGLSWELASGIGWGAVGVLALGFGWGSVRLAKSLVAYRRWRARIERREEWRRVNDWRPEDDNASR